MGTSLYGLTPAATYQGLIKFGDNSAISASLRYLSDGLGNDLPISVSSSNVGISTTTSNAKFNIGNVADAANGITMSASTGLLNIVPYYNSSYGVIMESRNSTNTAYNGFSISGSKIFLTDGNVNINTGGTDLGSKLAVKGTTSSGAVASFLVQNSGGTQIFRVDNDGTTSGLAGSFSSQIYIGTPGTAARLSIKSSGSTSATNAIFAQNSGSTQLFKVIDDGTIEAGGATATQFKVMNTSGLSVSRDASLDANIRIREFGTGGPVLKINGNGTPNFKFYDGSNFQCLLTDANWTGTGYLTTKNSSAALQTDSTTTGWLPPRMTDAQVRAIATPAVGLTCYNTDLDCPVFYSTAGWRKISHSAM
jgi:hypothetical protein